MARFDPNFWNVISMRGPTQPHIDRRGFKQIHSVICYDVAGGDPSDPEDMLGVPRREHLQAIFRFADSIAGQPILVHCQAGVSRSTAVALALIMRGMCLDGFGANEISEQAPQMLLSIRPQAAPNPLILELGLSEFMPPIEARQLTAILLKNPILLANRHGER
jgi:predicted protein tyrosine phosphatase